MGTHGGAFNPIEKVRKVFKDKRVSTREDTLRLSCKGQVGDTVRKTIGEERSISKNNMLVICVQEIRCEVRTKGAKGLIEELWEIISSENQGKSNCGGSEYILEV